MGNYISEPNMTFNILPAADLVGASEQQVLMVGQKLAAGGATAKQLIIDVDEGQVNNLFGAGSHLAGMIREFKALNRISRLDVFPADDPTGNQATAVLTFTGTAATGPGTIDIAVASAKRYSISINVAKDDTPTDIGADIVAAFEAIGADTNGIAPFTLANAAGVVTFTSRGKGTTANFWDLKAISNVPAVTVVLTTQWSGGTGDVDIGGLAAAIENIRYQTVVWPRATSYTIATIQSIMDARFNVDNNVLDGVAIQTYPGTLAATKTYADFNSQSMVIIWNETIDSATHKGNVTIEMPDIISTQVAALRSLRRSPGANLAPYQTTSATADQRGGIALASLPYANTKMPNIVPADLAEYPAFEDIEEASNNGLAQIGPNRSANATIMGEMVTTYLTDSIGAADTSYKYLNTVDTVSVIREFFFENFKARYAQTRLTNGDLAPGRAMANQYSIRAFANELYDALADDLLVQKGSEAKRDFNQNMTIAVDLGTGTVTIDIAPLLTSQLRAVIGTIRVNFASS